MTTDRTNIPATKRRRRRVKRKDKKPGGWIKQIPAEFVLPDTIEEIERGRGGTKVFPGK